MSVGVLVETSERTMCKYASLSSLSEKTICQLASLSSASERTRCQLASLRGPAKMEWLLGKASFNKCD